MPTHSRQATGSSTGIVADRGTSDAAKAQHRGDQRDDQKCDDKIQHVFLTSHLACAARLPIIHCAKENAAAE